MGSRGAGWRKMREVRAEAVRRELREENLTDALLGRVLTRPKMFRLTPLRARLIAEIRKRPGLFEIQGMVLEVGDTGLCNVESETWVPWRAWTTRLLMQALARLRRGEAVE